MTDQEEGFEEYYIRSSPFVYLQDEQVFGIIVSFGAFASRVIYVKDQISYDVVVENSDIMNGE